MFASGKTAAVSSAANYVEDVFSTYLYTGNTTAQTITNGIDLAGKGGMVWIKSRTSAAGHALWDTARTPYYYLVSNATSAEQSVGSSNALTSYNADGFTVTGGSNAWNGSQNYTSWTFRKQPKFFDIVTYTGNGVNGRTISHNLGSTPGFIVVKCTSSAAQWVCWHRSYNSGDGYGYLNDLIAWYNTGSDVWGNGTTYTAPTSTTFTVNAGSGLVNDSGATYVAYIYAHNAGGFGLTGTDNVISCGSYTGTGVADNNVTLGYEPQWVMIKRTDSTGDWNMQDVMRGMSNTDTFYLKANSSSAEIDFGYQIVYPNATGFTLGAGTAGWNASGGNYIYIAIRRGPMKVPTSGTSVFSPQVQTPTGSTSYVMAGSSGFPIDWLPTKQKDTVVDWYQTSRLTNNYMSPNTTAAEGAYTYGFDLMQGVSAQWSTNSTVSYAFRRAPSFFDEVCYTGTGSATTFTHNLGVTPELMIVKNRSSAGYGWLTYSATLGATKYLQVNSTAAEGTVSTYWNNTAPTSSVFSVGTAGATNASGDTFVAYLFATCAGVSKVGSYTGTGATQTISCGFTGGARFVLIKRTDSTGDWYVWDTARGIVSGNDPYLLLNSTAAETTTTDYIDPYSAGFEISSTAPAAINASGGSFIFLAIS